MALKQVWLLIVFGAYVGLIPLFGLSYFVLYRRRQTHFIFAGDIQASRIAEQRQQADDRISWLGVLIEYFEGFATDHRQGIATVEQSRVDTTLTLSDGRAIVLEKHIQHVPPHGANSELAPFVRLLRADHRKDREGRIVGHGFLS